MLGQPSAWMLSNANVVNFLIAHALVFYAPLVHAALKLRAVWVALVLTDVFNTAFSLTGGVARALSAAHPLGGSLAAVVVLGLVSGCGGGVMSSAFSLPGGEWKLQAPAPLKARFPFGLYPLALAAAVVACARVCQPNAAPEWAAHCADSAPLPLGMVADGQRISAMCPFL
jgi:hypothetical protein